MDIVYTTKDSGSADSDHRESSDTKSDNALREIVMLLQTAIRCFPEAYKVWKGWADMLFQFAQCVDRLSRVTPRGSFLSNAANAVTCCASAAAALAVERCPAVDALEHYIVNKAKFSPACHCFCHGSNKNHNDDASLTKEDGSLGSSSKKLNNTTDHSVWSDPVQHIQFVTEAAGGLIRALLLRPSNHNVQDVLRLVTLWFQVTARGFLIVCASQPRFCVTKLPRARCSMRNNRSAKECFVVFNVFL